LLLLHSSAMLSLHGPAGLEKRAIDELMTFGATDGVHAEPMQRPLPI